MALDPDASETERRLWQKNRELTILNAIAEGLNRALDLNEALESTLALVADLLGLRTAWLWLLDETGTTFYLAAGRHLPPALADHPERMNGNVGCLCLDTFTAGDLKGAANVSVLACSRLANLVGGTEGLRYHASVPIYTHEKPLGVLNVASVTWRSQDEDELQLLYTIGYQLGVAIERARLYRERRRLAAAEERNRLAREIHDTLAQGLTAIALQLEAAGSLLDTDVGRARIRIEKALTLTRTNLEEARRSVMDLRAAPLQEHPLPEALRLMVEQMGQLSGSQAHFRVEGGGGPLALPVENGLYRIAQEALTNIHKHAEAAHIWVTLRWGEGVVTLIVEDDGRGFKVEGEAEQRRACFGLQGIGERVHLLHGQWQLRSCRGAGTKIEVTIPVGSGAA